MDLPPLWFVWAVFDLGCEYTLSFLSSSLPFHLSVCVGLFVSPSTLTISVLCDVSENAMRDETEEATSLQL